VTPPGERYRLEIPGTLKFRFKIMAKNIFFNFANIAAAEKRPLSYKTPQSFHRPRVLWCSDLANSIQNALAYGSEKLGNKNWGRSGRILTPIELDLTSWVPDYGAKFHQNRARIATVGGRGGATPGPGRSYALPLKNWPGTWRWDLPVKF